MLKTLSRVGYVDKNMLHGKMGLAERRIINFQRDRYIEKCSFFNAKSKSEEEVYRLTDRGRNYIQKELGIIHFYRSSSCVHDLALAGKYLSLTNSERDTWTTESEQRDIFEDNLKNMLYEQAEELRQMSERHEISPVDASYTSNSGEHIGVEIITSSYGDAEIQAKEEFCSAMNLKQEFIKI